MRSLSVSLLFSALLSLPVLSACQGDDNALPLPPADAGADAKTGDATVADAATHDASELDVAASSELDGAASDARSDAGPQDGAAEAATTDAAQLD
jgi:hypothetical protein